MKQGVGILWRTRVRR